MISPYFETYLQKKGYKYENRLLADSTLQFSEVL